MANKKNPIDNLLESFATEDEAGEFWDSLGASDYIEFLEPAEEELDLTNRVYEVRVSEEIFNGLRKKAESTHQSVTTTVNQILRKELSLAE